MTRDEAIQLRKLLVRQTAAMTDDEILEVPAFVEKWKPGVSYTIGDRLNHNGTIYKVLQSHTSQASWDPNMAPSLFAKLLPGQGGTEIGEWQQPDSTNPYMTGDKVIFEGVVYESTIDNNIWSPSAYPAGWRQLEV